MQKNNRNIGIFILLIVIVVAVSWSVQKNNQPAVVITQNGAPTQTNANDVKDSAEYVYTVGSTNISLRYPLAYTVDKTYAYQALGPGKDIAGVKFTIPKTVSEGTNLSKDSYISVESVPQNTVCSASNFAQEGAISQTVQDKGVTYSVASTSDAGAGNRYDEIIYAISGSNPCVAVRYFIHYGVFENFPEGSIRQFDKQALVTEFDKIRESLTIRK